MGIGLCSFTVTDKGANVVDIIDKALRMGEGHQLKKLENVAKAVNALEDEISALSDDELKAQTGKFKQRLDNGEKLDSLMPEAFATVREVSKRTLGQRHFDVQLMGGAALHWGNIAEMKTGEGKTLVATLPSYLNALEGKGVHVVTVNDYLASYQSELMGRIYRFLGMSVGCILTEQKPPERRKQYNADITYGTNNEFGFDYLRDNMAWEKSDLVQRGHHYAIVDEVDSILIDEARTPLIISGPAEGDVTRWYRQFARLVPKLTRDEDYEVDEKKKTVGILDPGITKVEDFLGIDNLYEPNNTALIGYLNNAIKAKELFLRDRDYVVTGGEVLIVDEHTGRILPGRRYNEGLHQAIEAKENVEVKAENQTFATITLQNYFRMYDKLAGMTGTAETEAAEFMGTYKLGVLPIPTNKPMIRVDQDDLIFRTKREKLAAIVKDVAKRHAKGQPVLLGTASVESSEVVSSLLDVAGIPHQVLNAKQHAKEAAVVAVAGRKGAVTVATNMAGRGTDIMLGGNVEFLADAKLKAEGYSPDDTPEEYEKRWPGTLAEVKEQVKDEHEEVVGLGGLYVLGTERHESRRIDNQLRGRSGRQGDVGASVFFISLEDDLMQRFGGDRMKHIYERSKMQDDECLESKVLTNLIEYAQKQIEGRNFAIRKNVLQYDDVMNKQRMIMYAERMRVIRGENVHEQVLKYIPGYVEGILKETVNIEDSPEKWSETDLNTALERYLLPEGTNYVTREKLGKWDYDVALKRITDKTTKCYEEKIARIQTEMPGVDFGKVERDILLSYVNSNWIDHIDAMDQLRKGIGLRSYGQSDPVIAYKQEGFAMFDEMVERIQERTIRFLLKCQIKAQPRPVQRIFPSANRPAQPAQQPAGVQQNTQPAQQPAAQPVQQATQSAAQPAQAQQAEPVETVGAEALPKAVDVDSLRTSGDVKFNPATIKKDKKVGPNDPCPCGSGLKYKKCHGRPY